MPMAVTRANSVMGTGKSSGSENANLYMRGVSEGHSGDLLDARELVDLLDVFGEEGLRSYLIGYLEGEADAQEEEQGLE